jgi:hypothetical protein
MHEPPEPRTDGNLNILSDEDIERRLADCFVELRERLGDDDAAWTVDVVHTVLTDDYYAHDE